MIIIIDNDNDDYDDDDDDYDDYNDLDGPWEAHTEMSGQLVRYRLQKSKVSDDDKDKDHNDDNDYNNNNDDQNDNENFINQVIFGLMVWQFMK